MNRHGTKEAPPANAKSRLGTLLRIFQGHSEIPSSIHPRSKNSNLCAMGDETLTINRGFFRLTSGESNMIASELINMSLLEVGLPLNTSRYSPHYIYEQRQQGRVHYIVLDINPAAAVPNIIIEDIPYEFYRVQF